MKQGWILAGAVAIVILAIASGGMFYFYGTKEGMDILTSDAPEAQEKKGDIQNLLAELKIKRLFSIEAQKQRLARFGLEVVGEKEAKGVFEALKGDDEDALIKALEAAKVQAIGLPLNLDRELEKPGSLFSEIVNNGILEQFSYAYADGHWAIVTPTAKAYRLTKAQMAKVIEYLRVKLSEGYTPQAKENDDTPAEEEAKEAKEEKEEEGIKAALPKKAPELPKAFGEKLSQKAIIDMRFTDSVGYNKRLGLIRAQGESVQAALDALIKEAKARYENRGNGRSTPEPLGLFLQSAKLTLSLHKERGLFNIEKNRRWYRFFALGLDGVEMEIPVNDKGKPKKVKTLFAPAIMAKVYRTDKASDFFEAIGRRERLPKDAWKKPGVKIKRFRSVSFTERKPQGEVISLLRGAEYIAPEEVDKALAMKSFTQGAAWLLSIFDEKKRMFTYEYYAVNDNTRTNRYNIIRHGLATLTLIQAYELLGDERYLKAAKLAVEWVLDRLEWKGDMAFFHHPRYDKKYKLGGAGVIVQCMTEIYRLKKIPEWEKPMKGLAEFMMHLQKENGHYNSFYTKPGQKPIDREVTIYPGEANLALVRMYKLFKDERHLETVRKAFEYYSEWFEENKNPRSKGSLGAFVPWDMSAMVEYWEIVKKDEVAEYAYSMADWVLDNWFVFSLEQTHYKDFIGGVHHIKRMSAQPPWNTGVYGEGIASVWHLADMRGDEKKAAHYRKAVLLVLRFIRQLQYHEGNSFHLEQTANALGCIPSNFQEDDCRLDYAYHCLTGNYRAIRFFDEADWKAAQSL